MDKSNDTIPAPPSSIPATPESPESGTHPVAPPALSDLAMQAIGHLYGEHDGDPVLSLLDALGVDVELLARQFSEDYRSLWHDAPARQTEDMLLRLHARILAIRTVHAERSKAAPVIAPSTDCNAACWCQKCLYCDAVSAEPIPYGHSYECDVCIAPPPGWTPSATLIDFAAERDRRRRCPAHGLLVCGVCGTAQDRGHPTPGPFAGKPPKRPEPGPYAGGPEQ